MRLFNARLSGLRTVMSENVFGIWKKRFPVLRMLRTHYLTSKDIILATAILHNVAMKLGEVSQHTIYVVCSTLFRAVCYYFYFYFMRICCIKNLLQSSDSKHIFCSFKIHVSVFYNWLIIPNN
jgi:hypothetical protein